MSKTFVKYESANHDGKQVIFIRFSYDADLIKRVKKLTGVKWSQRQKAWYVLDTEDYRKRFGMVQKVASKQAWLNIHPVNQSALIKFVNELHLKAYSANTIATYKAEFAQLLYILKEKPAKDLTPEKLQSYFLFCINKLRLSENTIHSRMNAIKFYYEQVLHRKKMFIDIPRPKKPAILPNVLAISQVEQLFLKLKNLKHKAMLFLAYSAGLRVSEVVNLKVRDIHTERMMINIKGAKGKKDRIVALSEGILIFLRKYYLAYQPKEWLFEGSYKGTQYSTRSLQQIFQRTKTAAGIGQQVTFHSLRHSYATHLHERGTDIKLIQELLGHNNIKTTMRYTHVSNFSLRQVKSPFDSLNLNTHQH